MTERCVIVTGAESGIGAACARAFGALGDKVAILYHSDAGLAEASADVVRAAGGTALPLQCSIDDEASVDAAFATVTERFGIASVLVFPSLVFPFVDALTGTIYAFAVFSLGFIARPIGSVVFMAVDRRHGRGVKLTMALFLLGSATVAISFLPGYAETPPSVASFSFSER